MNVVVDSKNKFYSVPFYVKDKHLQSFRARHWPYNLELVRGRSEKKTRPDDVKVGAKLCFMDLLFLPYYILFRIRPVSISKPEVHRKCEMCHVNIDPHQVPVDPLR